MKKLSLLNILTREVFALIEITLVKYNMINRTFEVNFENVPKEEMLKLINILITHKYKFSVEYSSLIITGICSTGTPIEFYS